MIEYSNQRNLYPTNPKKKKNNQTAQPVKDTGGGGVLLGILGGAVSPGSPNPDPNSDQKNCNFLHQFSDQTVKIHTRCQTWP